MAKKSTNLKLSQVKKEYKETQEKEIHTFQNGSTLDFYPYFTDSKLDEMIHELSADFKHAEEKGIIISEKFQHDYILFMCIKTFTHLSKEIPAEFELKYQVMEQLVDTGYFKEIIEDAFLPEQIRKVWDKMTEIGSKYAFLESLTKKMQNEIQNLELKNKDVIEGISKKKLNVEM